MGTPLTDTTLPGCQCGELRHALRDRGIRSPDRQDRPGWQRRTGDLWLLWKIETIEKSFEIL